MKEYYLGLDMGTTSVGWAVTDQNYKLLRAKGKDLWGVRLFEEASTAAERRTNRVSRRRREREVARIGLLKEFFSDEIGKIDPNFYERLDDSKYFIEDKKQDSKFGIFGDENFTDKQYYEKYKTIFHLRMDLISSTDKKDIRLIYLAILNLFKHRGHFLDKNMGDEVNINSIDEAYHSLVEAVDTVLEQQFIQQIEYERLAEILKEKGVSRTKRAENLADFLQITKKEKVKYEIVKGICGLEFSLLTIFGETSLDEENKKLKLGFTKSNFDENAEKANGLLGDEAYEIITMMKQLHDLGVFLSVMQGNKYLSEARMKSYEKHKSDLRLLKDVIVEYAPEKYDDMFRNEVDGSYSAYVKSSNANVKIRRGMKKTTKEDLYATIKGLIKDIEGEDERVEYIKNEMLTEDFLPKQLTSANGVIPNQVHAMELKAILKNAQQHYDFLLEKDETNLTVSEKIEQIFSFQIPYYIGPLNTQHKGKGGNAWVIRKEGAKGPILPWNFEEKIDTMATAEQFIGKMVRKCTYLSGEMCLPNSSLLYERYKVLNELNNVKVRDEKLSVELKQKVYEQLFLKGKKVTKKQLCSFLTGVNGGLDLHIDDITGIDGDFKNSLSSYGKFKDVFGDNLKLDSTKKMVEDIIYWGTIYGEDKKFLKKRILSDYEKAVSKEQLNRICGFKFKDWGNLSRSFLEMEGCDKLIGESISIIQMMWETNENLMQLLSENYNYLENLEEKSRKVEKSLAEFEYEDLEDSYLSMPVKRMVWQTIQIIQELQIVLGNEPKKIFVEMARGPEEKKRTTSRKAKLLELYKGCKVDARDWCEEIKNRDEATLRSKKLYLYYLQQGRCMYSGRAINLDDLMKSNSQYDIDHIYPQSYVKDDSLENNLALVEKGINNKKQDTYPLPREVYDSQKGNWKELEKRGFITKEKYNRLICRDSFTDEQMAGFINRQLVETRQGTKTITQILKQTCGLSEIIYVQGRVVSDFRRNDIFGEEKPIKCRSVNDFHHAHDAYLNVVVGNVYNTKFTKSPLQYMKENRVKKEDKTQKSPYHMGKIFNSDVIRGKEWAWKVKAEDGQMKSRDIVLKMLHKDTPLITFMTISGHGAISNATLYPARKANQESYISLKASDERLQDVTKYGGLTSVSTGFFTVIEYTDEKGKRIRSIEAMPLYLFKDRMDKELIKQYCETKFGIKEVRVCVDKIPMHSLLRVNGYYVRITGKTENRYAINNMIPLKLKQKEITYIKWLDDSAEGTLKIGITKEDNIKLFDMLIYKHETTIYKKKKNSILKTLVSGRDKFIQLEVEEQCKVLQEVIKNTRLRNDPINLLAIGGAKNAGVSLLGKKVTEYDEMVLIHQSVTGLFVREIDLLKV